MEFSLSVFNSNLLSFGKNLIGKFSLSLLVITSASNSFDLWAFETI